MGKSKSYWDSDYWDYEKSSSKKENKEKKEKKAAKKRQSIQKEEARERIIDSIGGEKSADARIESWGRGLIEFVEQVRSKCIIESMTPSKYRNVADQLLVIANDMVNYHCTYMLDPDNMEDFMEKCKKHGISLDDYQFSSMPYKRHENDFTRAYTRYRLDSPL